MEVRLSRLDLDVAYRGTIAAPAIEIQHFEPAVQNVIQAAGCGIFVDKYDSTERKILSRKAA